MKKKKEKTKRKINALNLWATIISIIVVIGLLGVSASIFFIYKLIDNRPTLNLSDFDQAESSIIYDQDGEEIANLGTIIRSNVDYLEVPDVVIDAFVAVEDSRFFEHNGFDLPRFTKAIIENVISRSFGQGGSTFTMQLVKNTYFTNDDTGEEASRDGLSGVRRKAQEIALSLELETLKSKQDILTSYLNKLNFGGANIRGIEKACQYYFGKDINQINLNEAAFLAGVINAPNYYNPFYNLEAGQERMEEVLYLMNYHGYISDTEYKLAKSIRLEDLLCDPYENDSEGEGIPYQAYIDVVISEVIDLTGLDPYTTTMHIYTYMNKGIQSTMDKIQAGDMDGYLTFPDDYFECASVCMDTHTGQVVGILGGRNYANGGALLLNHATEQSRQPGSSIKPILDYSLAFENLGWATSHVLTDKPMYMDKSKVNLVYNFSGTYVGDVTLKEAVGSSINTTAIQTLQQVIDSKGYEYVVNYGKSIGYDFTLDDFNIQYAVGGSTCEVTPYQHVAALGMIMNGGVYNTPHTIKKIEFTNGKSPITPTYESKQVLSEQAAYLTTELLYSNVQTYGGSYSYVKTDYPVYAKTGTTDYGYSAVELGVPRGATKDGWLIASTSEYSIATWVGYEKVIEGKPSYITDDYYYNQRPQAKITRLILDATIEYGDETPTKIAKPSGITTISHIIGTFPYAAIIDGMDNKLKTTGLIKSDAVKLVNLPTPTVEELSDKPEVSYDLDGKLKIKWPTYPDESKLKVVEDTKDISLKSSSGEVIVAATGKVLFDYSWIYGPIRYMADIEIYSSNGTETKHIVSEENKYETAIAAAPGTEIKITVYYGYQNNESVTSSKYEFKTKAQATFVVPSGTRTKSDLENWASNYSFISFKTIEDDALAGTYKLVNDSNNITMTPGQTVTVTGDETYTLTYYVEKEITISLINTKDENGVIYITAVTNAPAVTWSIDNNNVSYDLVDGDPNKIKIIVNGVGITQYTITAKYKDISKSLTIMLQE